VATLIETEAAVSRLENRVDLFQFAAYLRRRWLVVAISIVIACALALIGSLVQGKRYTATASILIEAPAGNDPRGATAVSAIYLESLKTYEHFANSNTLFAQALNHLKLRDAHPAQSLEGLKKRVLRVSKLRDTKILQISATLDNPAKAQELAQYIARETVDLNRSLERDSEHDVTEQASKTLAEATARLQTAEAARDAFAAANPIESLEGELRNANDLLARVTRELSDTREDLAQYVAQSQAASEAVPAGADADWPKRQIAGIKARILSAEKEQAELAKSIAQKSRILEERKHRREVLDIERQAARGQYEAANTRKNEILSSGSFRGERLAVIDAGTVPERPSSPNIPLNVAVALLLSFMASMLYLSFAFGLSRLRQLRDLEA
jgi:uncharacterized protein involved in exopolysaccharide biosynthesis